MICHKLFNQVEPTDSLHGERVFIKVNERNLHLVHYKENVISDQPSQDSNRKHAQVNSAFSSDNNISNSIDENNAETFSKLFDSKRFNLKKTSNGLFFMDGMNTTNFSIIYKNKIKLPKKLNDIESNNKNKPMLFWIHGVGGSSKIWSKQLEYFNAKGYELCAIDLIGHGQSEATSDKNNYQFMEIALDILLIFDLFRKADNVLIGHSYGCSFSQYISQSRKEFISKIILISGGSPHPLDFKSPLLSAPLCLIQCIHPFLNCHFYCSAFKSCCKLPKNSTQAFKISSKVLLYTMKGQTWTTANEDFHKKFNQPVLLIEGEKDNFVPLDDALDMIKVLKNGYLVVLKEGSHMMIMEDHELINHLICLFLNDTFTE